MQDHLKTAPKGSTPIHMASRRTGKGTSKRAECQDDPSERTVALLSESNESDSDNDSEGAEDTRVVWLLRKATTL